jgi:hypothetical protein
MSKIDFDDILNDNHLIKLLKLHPLKRWDWDALLRNPNMPWDFIETNLDNVDCYWDMEILSKHPGITCEFLKNHSKHTKQ